jgi:DNA-directed RNA polymerase subunit RPC12/RpoP
MNKIIEAFLVIVGVGLLLLGGIFIIAGTLDTIVIGGLMVLAAAGLFFFVYRSMKVEAAKPTLVNQTFNVKMEGSGTFQEKEMKCRSCGAPLTDKDLKVIQGGIMATCPYCGAVFAMQEEPKW